MRLKRLSARNSIVFNVFGLITCATTLHAAENWQVIFDADPLSQQPACLMESMAHVIDDGQTQTPVKLIYNGRELVAQTKSKIDLTYPNVGLQVDSKTSFGIDHLHKEKTAVFAKQSTEIHQQFIDGLTARLSLGFWPTWPQTKTRVIDFNLIGYTKAYQEFEQCRANGGKGKQ